MPILMNALRLATYAFHASALAYLAVDLAFLAARCS